MLNTKEVVTEKAEKMAAFLKEAEDFPMVKMFRAEKAAATLAKRQEAAGKIEVLKKEQDEAIPRLLADRDAKEVKYKEARAALDTAGREFNTARSRLSIEGQSFNGQISQQEQILFETADPALDAAILFFTEKLSWLRSPGRVSRNACGGKSNIVMETITRTVESNLDAVHSALEYCMAAVKELERMKLTPALDLQKIEGMKKGIPDIDVYTEYTGEKPYGKTIADVNPRMLLPSDSEMDWKLAKLYEKTKKILGR